MILTKEDLREYIRTHSMVSIYRFGEEHSRAMRKTLSEERRAGRIMIPCRMIKGEYWDIRVCNQEMIDKYAAEQAKHLRTQYFNTLKPLKSYIADEHINALMGRLDDAIREEERGF